MRDGREVLSGDDWRAIAYLCYVMNRERELGLAPAVIEAITLSDHTGCDASCLYRFPRCAGIGCRRYVIAGDVLCVRCLARAGKHSG